MRKIHPAIWAALITSVAVVVGAVIGNCDRLRICPDPNGSEDNIDLTGTWSGTAVSSNGYTFDIIFYFNQPCRAGEICGKFSLSLGCDGDVQVLEVAEKRVRWTPINSSEGCAGAGTDTLTLNPDGTLHYLFEDGKGGSSEGTLRKQ